MKRFLLFAVVVALFTACTQEITVDVTNPTIADDAPETLVVGFEGDDTRIQLQGGKTVWTQGDQVSVFYKSDANQKWQYNGETGSRTAELKRVDAGVASARMDRVVVAYPYSDNYLLNLTTGDIEATMPAVQTYMKDSYGLDGNIMVASSYFTQFNLKNVCGWLKLQLTGDGEVVKSIKLRGNNGEQVAGLIYVDTENATSILASEMGDVTEDDGENITGGAGGNLVFDDTILTEVTLDCGEGVTLGKSATAFYIALPPQTFTKGFKVEIVCADDTKMVKSSNNELSIERNHIQPMTAMEFTPSVPNNQIWYTATDVVEPNNIDAFGATIISNEWDSETDKGIITFDGNVTMVGFQAFWGCDSLTSVNIPDSVTTIGDWAFVDCDSLTSVTIGNSVTTIGERAFDDCDSLTSVNIPDSVKTIGEGAFAACYNLKEFTGKYAADGGRCLIIDNTIIAYAYASGTTYNIPESVKTIGDFAFLDCSSLTSVNIPDSVTTIGNYAFSDCYSLTSVNIPDSVTTIGNYAFSDCYSLTSVNIPDSVTTIGDWAFCECDSLTSVIIGDSVTTIGDCTFSACISLTSVNIPDSVTTIGERAFFCCDSLTSVDIGDSVTTIGEGAFAGSSNLKEFTGKFAEDNGRILVVDGVLTAFAPAGVTEYTISDSVTTIGERAFFCCDSLTSVNISDSVTTIGEFAFIGCKSLTSVNIPDSVTTIGYEAFYCCDSLTSVNIPDSVKMIGNQAFEGCVSLTSVNIGNSVTTIGEGAFGGCDSLTSVNIPDSVTTIGDYAFWYCTSLKYVYCKATTPPALGGSDVFGGNASGRRIIVPIGSGEAYKTAEYWSEYAYDIIEDEF